jgi:hypothetical protein
MTEDDKLEEEAVALFNCDKNIVDYLLTSGGSIGPSKLGEKKSKQD